MSVKKKHYVNSLITDVPKAAQPEFASGSCFFGTVGRSAEDGQLYMWTDDDKAVNLSNGFVVNGDKVTALQITPLPKDSAVKAVFNERQNYGD